MSPVQRVLLVTLLTLLFVVPATLVYGQRGAEWQSLNDWVDWNDPCRVIEGTVPVADDAPLATLQRLARVTEAQARDAALDRLPGATVTEIDLDEEDGYVIYEVELLKDGVEYDVAVDAGTGAVLCAERD